MARPLRIEYPGAFYHVTSRGNERKDIFKSNTDREMFLSYLASAQEKYEAVVHAYCLMSNHYHLMIETPQGNLSQIMKYINSSYTNFFNIKRKRTGHLLQGRYKAVLVEADAYAAELSRYIHLNPVRAGMVRSPEEYRWSSYSYYTERSSPSWLKTGFILGYFGTDPTQSRRDYRNYVNTWGQTYTIDICCNLKDSLIDRSDREMLLPGKKNRGRWKRSVPVIRKGIICVLSQSPKRMQVL